MRWLIHSTLFIAACSAFGQTYNIKTLAGGVLPVNVPATSAMMLRTGGVAVDSSGNVFISLQTRHVVVRVPAAGGNLTLVAGNGTSGFSGDSGRADAAQLSYPAGLAFDSAGNL